jgi:ABC-type sugar transport system permease subunit
MTAQALTEAPSIVVRRRRIDTLPYLLVGLPTLLVGSFTVLALIFTAFASLTDWDIGRRNTSFVGLGNYVRAFSDPDFVKSLLNSLIFVGGVVAISIAGGFLLAVALNRRFAGRAVLRTVVVVPWVISELATGVFWAILLAADGPLGSAMGRPLTDPTGAMVALILVECWRSVGLVTVMTLASLQTVDQSLYDAAKIDGASPMRTMVSITFPMIMPTIVVLAILLTIGNFNLVTIIIALTAGGPIDATTTTALYMYQQSFYYFHIGYGSSIAIIMSVLNVLVMLLFLFASKHRY